MTMTPAAPTPRSTRRPPAKGDAGAQWVPVDALRPWEKNPRRNDPAVPRVAASIRRFGFVAPIVVWIGGNRMVAGHTRLKAMRALMAEDAAFTAKGAPGPGMVRVVFHEFASEADADAYAIADNKLAEIAEWDHAGVAEVLARISDEDRVVCGFEAPIVIEEDGPKPVPEPKPPPKPEPQKLGRWEIVHGDALEVLRSYPDNHFDALLSDPPYGISFMGKGWDYGLPPIEIWQEALRVLKPGAPVVTFSATRTFHRLAVSIEDAGFEPRDCFCWLYGSGFPKSLDVSKAIDEAAGAEREPTATRMVAIDRWTAQGRRRLEAGEEGSYAVPVTAPATTLAQSWDGYGTALKPAWEPAILARKPLDGTVAENVARWGVGGLAIDACRIGTGDKLGRTNNGRDQYNPTSYTMAAQDRTTFDRSDSAGGRWPANVLLDPEAARMLDEQSGTSTSRASGVDTSPSNASGAVHFLGENAWKSGAHFGDSGGASRFFYVAKASRREREAGCSELPPVAKGTDALRDGERTDGAASNGHPCVKPITLARYLATLLAPPPRETPRRLLVPFCGSGSEVIGGLLAGWDDVVGIEREAEYVAIANARVAFYAEHPDEADVVDDESEDDGEDCGAEDGDEAGHSAGHIDA